MRTFFLILQFRDLKEKWELWSLVASVNVPNEFTAGGSVEEGGGDPVLWPWGPPLRGLDPKPHGER